MEKFKELKAGLNTAFINTNYNSNLAYRPEFISNDYKKGKKVLASIESELENCDEFSISVAFIKQSGIAPLLMTLKELEKKGIPGKILTTDYLTFSEPKALKTLASLKNIELKMFRTNAEIGGFHTKGYIFKKEEIYRIIIGSSNMTLSAITKNREWNTKIVSTEEGQMAKDILDEFNDLWEDDHTLSYKEFIDEYEREYLESQLIKKQQKAALQDSVVDLDRYKLKPNKMQLGFIKNLLEMRKNEVDRALLLSSTGTGKTYASAFALRELQPEKVLFLVHREQIAKQSIKSYKKVFGKAKTYGLLSGRSREMDEEYLFSTMQMMAKEEIRSHYKRDEFDIIVLDECHHVGAESYQKIMEYFQPKFWLGMTATPDTNNYDIYSIFNHQIAYEIRLQQALEEDLLCPFHYFGITDLEFKGEAFNKVRVDEKVDYVIDKAEYYGFSGDRVKGLIFVSQKSEAKEVCKEFNKKGYKTAVLTGEDNQEEREKVIERLTDDNCENPLDYIITIDIFNEGVDIPEINQVILLRPTQSAVVFVQQLGRGLRKFEDKEYVVILDFIGNYQNNFLIPVALSGDRTYNKDNVRKYVISGNNIIPGSSSIHFDEISKNRIFDSIDKIKGIRGIIKESYTNLKNRLGRIPYLMDFYNEGEVDPLIILSNFKTYENFIEAMEGKTYINKLSESENLILEYLSKNIAAGKRVHELEILDEVISRENVSKKLIRENIERKYDFYVDLESIDNALEVLNGQFVSKNDELKKYSCVDIFTEEASGVLKRKDAFSDKLNNPIFSKELNDILTLGLRRFQDNYTDKRAYRGKFILYEKYSRRDVCLLLNWGRDYSSTMYGMKRVDENVCLFVTYHKMKKTDEQGYIDGKPDYADQFLDNQTFMWDSQIGKGPDSSYMKDVEEGKYKHLFVKKSDAETTYYYMGMFDIEWIKKDEKLDNSGRTKVISKVKLRMQDGVREDLLKYLKSIEINE